MSDNSLNEEVYYLVYLDNSNAEQTTVVRVKDISNEEFKKFEKYRDCLNFELQRYLDRFSMIEIAYNNLVDAYNHRIKRLESKQGFDARDDLVEMNTYFISFISVMGTYLSCVPKMISSARQTVKEKHASATHDEYDSHFAYRLFYYLRNYTLHDTPPITGIKGSSRVADTPEGVDVEYGIYIEKKELMKNSLLNKKLRNDFNNDIDLYPVMEYAEKTIHSLENIHWKTIAALMPPLQNEMKYFDELKSLVSVDKKPYIASIKKAKDREGYDTRLFILPLHLLDVREYIQKTYGIN